MRSVVSKCLRALREGRHPSERKRTHEYLGCSFHDLKAHLEKDDFHGNPGMSWENYGSLWHVDHIVPIQYRGRDGQKPDVETVISRLHHSNLQPMWGEDNLRKGNRFLRNEPGVRTEGISMTAESAVGRGFVSMGAFGGGAKSARDRRFASTAAFGRFVENAGGLRFANTVVSGQRAESVGDLKSVSTADFGQPARSAGARKSVSTAASGQHAEIVGEHRFANTVVCGDCAKSVAETEFVSMVGSEGLAESVEVPKSVSTGEGALSV
uniref:Uncharacterized protein n=1 Tax=Chromera velia CCMP2878 TaxID=1169474 RepID=A0A0G4HA45_9ALVE|eukprot:Cvel_6061.t1-p1 / transcript=Cvel_6061.t1 / gene=Cvel_6061 / organism=Chromera_velia_CCMP2878 / gene_product=Zinc finger protein 571, putative / transcript_product=Zinc finger protein 571, putative / location=Cvel_scaffold291:79387-80668(+) / protein_length=266 / sequence_SO=supercontig / SO=protein_coding / is_pseudo=false